MTRITIRMQAETPPVSDAEDPLASLGGGGGGPTGGGVSSLVDDDPLASLGPIPERMLGQRQEQPSDPSVALDQLNAELGRLRESKSDSALFRAYQLSPQIFDDAHKGAFLHTENYVVKAAADRMIAYWEARADLFGEDRMLLPMDKSGSLREEDSLALDQGLLQLLPQKDDNGHALLFFDPSRHNPKLGYSNDSMLRVVWYIMHVALEDPIIRENGFVLTVYPKQCTPEQIDRDLIAKGTAIIGSVMPLPWRGFHICHPCSSYNKYFPLVKMLSPIAIKDNIAVHFGTDEHVLECMAGYAIPADRLPSQLGGGEQLDYPKWISDRKQLEGAHALRVSTPRPASVPADEVMKDASPASPTNLSPRASPKPKAAKPKKSTKTSAAPSAMAAVAAPPRPKTKKNARPAPSPTPETDASKSSSPAPGAAASGTTKTRRPGRKGDARMHRAVTLKIENPDTSLVEALQEGGFNFEGLNEKGKPHHEVFDQDGVSLMQRKNQLLRRIRVEKKKKKDETKE